MKHLLLLISVLIAGCSTNEVPRKSPEDKKADIHYTHGTASLKNKDYTNALEKLISANHFRSNDTKILNNLGMAYYFKEDLANAEKYLIEAIKADEKNSDAKNNLASLYFNRGDYEKARVLYQQIRKDLLYRAQYRVLYNLALIEFKRGDSLTTKSLLDLSLDQNADYCPSHFLMGRLNEVGQNYQEAYNSYRRAYQGVCLKSPSPHFKSAEMLEKMGKLEQAKAKYNEIIENFSKTKFASMAMERSLRINSDSAQSSYSEASSDRMKKLEDELNKFQAPSF